ncbi:MAG: 50S ribosomal protein L11 methyltransferase [Actinobacteria bacterium]|nr:50S ribosomal protein L11 methyltransferase [Actinomycetota bacterium]
MVDDGRWVRVVVEVTPADAELAADVLWAFGPAAIEEQAGGSTVRLLAGFVDATAARPAAEALARRHLGAAEVVPVDDDGLDGWRAWARPVAAGPFTITPAWLADEVAAPGRLLVDPGRTFGSGSHPTTRLVLARAARLVRPGDRVLDVGCGSGVLAIGAALLGAAEVHGIDVDPGSPATTAANARANGVADRVTASAAPLADVAARPGDEGRYDLVLANLLAPVVMDLSADLAAVVGPAGRLVVSGLLADRWEPAVRAVRDAADPPTRLAVESVDEDDGWVAVTLAG